MVKPGCRTSPWSVANQAPMEPAPMEKEKIMKDRNSVQPPKQAFQGPAPMADELSDEALEKVAGGLTSPASGAPQRAVATKGVSGNIV
jgi:hypothetical protein